MDVNIYIADKRYVYGFRIIWMKDPAFEDVINCLKKHRKRIRKIHLYGDAPGVNAWKPYFSVDDFLRDGKQHFD